MSLKTGKSVNSSLKVGSDSFAIVGGNRSVLHAAQYLKQQGVELVALDSIEDACNLGSNVIAVLIGGDGWIEHTNSELIGSGSSRIAGTDEGISEILVVGLRSWDSWNGRHGKRGFRSIGSRWKIR